MHRRGGHFSQSRSTEGAGCIDWRLHQGAGYEQTPKERRSYLNSLKGMRIPAPLVKRLIFLGRVDTNFNNG